MVLNFQPTKIFPCPAGTCSLPLLTSSQQAAPCCFGDKDGAILAVWVTGSVLFLPSNRPARQSRKLRGCFPQATTSRWNV